MVLNDKFEEIAQTEAFGMEELSVLAALMGSARFPGVQEAPEWNAAAREAALTAARRSLVARGVVVVPAAGALTLASRYVELIGIPLTAELVLAVERRDREQTYVRQYYARPTTSVEHSIAIGNVHRLTRFPSTELAVRVLEFAGLEKRAKADADPFSTDEETFALLRDGVRAGDLAEARESLGDEGASFVAAMETFASWCRVTVLLRSNGAVAGGETTWIDAGGALWRLESDRSNAESARVTIVPCSGRELVDEIIARLMES